MLDTATSVPTCIMFCLICRPSRFFPNSSGIFQSRTCNFFKLATLFQVFNCFTPYERPSLFVFNSRFLLCSHPLPGCHFYAYVCRSWAAVSSFAWFKSAIFLPFSHFHLADFDFHSQVSNFCTPFGRPSRPCSCFPSPSLPASSPAPPPSFQRSAKHSRRRMQALPERPGS
jgi:hypothetical protein